VTEQQAVDEARRRWGPRGHARVSGYDPHSGAMASHHCQVGIMASECLWVCGSGSTWEDAFRVAKVWWEGSPCTRGGG
jgi:hypothetical protein